jgi:hypothetical protein
MRVVFFTALMVLFLSFFDFFAAILAPLVGLHQPDRLRLAAGPSERTADSPGCQSELGGDRLAFARSARVQVKYQFAGIKNGGEHVLRYQGDRLGCLRADCGSQASGVLNYSSSVEFFSAAVVRGCGGGG